MRTLSFLMRGVIADNAQAIHDAHAVTILRQQIRDAAGALATARRELAVAMAYHAAETRALAAIGTRIDTLSDGARRALADGRADLGTAAAIHIAALEDERADRRAAAEPLRRRGRAAEAPGRAGERAAAGSRPRAPDRPYHRGAAPGGARGPPGHGPLGRAPSARPSGRWGACARGRRPRRTSPPRWRSWRPRPRAGSRPISRPPATAAPARTRGRCSTASRPRA